MESHRLIDAFKSKANAEEIISLLKEFFVTKDDDSMDGMYHFGEGGSIAVLPRRCGPLSPGSIPGPDTECPCGLQSKLASAGFLWVLWFSSRI